MREPVPEAPMKIEGKHVEGDQRGCVQVVRDLKEYGVSSGMTQSKSWPQTNGINLWKKTIVS